jgi:hypothetical protein
MSARPQTDVDDGMLQRVCGEFLEMPGLRLTSQQAQRLWALDEQTCRNLLDFLVDARFLCRQGQGAYARATDGIAERPPLRMAIGCLDDASTPRALKAAV